MKKLASALAIVFAALQSPVAAHAEDASKKCDVGPVTRTYGNAPWLVYSCRDKRSVVLVSAPGNAASPAFFVFYPRGEGYELRNQGSANQAISAAAYEELSRLTPKDIADLISATEAK
jgi:hypothetical protein